MIARSRRCAAVLTCLGLGLAGLGLLTYLLFPRLLRWKVEETLVLSPLAETYDYWRLVPVPIHSRFYFFNVTNAPEVVKGAKPVLRELGPYTFRESREKVNVTWHPNGTVSYRQVRRWHFEPGLTSGSLDDPLTSVNTPLAAAVRQAIDSEDSFFLDSVGAMVGHVGADAFVTRPVRQWLFEGYREELLVTAREMGMEVPHERFGWFYPKNNSDDGVYTIFTGATGVEKYGHVDRWNGRSVVSGRQPPCDKIEGTAGDMWPPFRRSPEQKLPLFVADICSSLRLSFLSEVEVDGVRAYRYWLDETAFDNGRRERRNACQCGREEEEERGCLPPGALDIARCQRGAPAAVSFPHFLYADSSYGQKVDGLQPDPVRHRFVVDLEPQLGIPVHVDAKLQINIALPKCDEIEPLEFPTETIYYPVFWFSESASVDVETAEKLRFVTHSLPQYVTVCAFVMGVAGTLMLVLGLHLALRGHRAAIKRKEQKKTYTAVRKTSNL